ncbi:MAG: 5-formyltetrahydrofolate cyclo-ligase [Pseudomonadota bacterium]
MPAKTPVQRDSIRRDLRQRRARLGRARRQVLSSQICQHIAALPEYRTAQHLAMYLAIGSEVDLDLLLTGDPPPAAIWLPRVVDQQMVFAAWQAGEPLEQTSLGTRQPTAAAPLREATAVDLVLLPLLGFDGAGNRLGQGGGYYDRTFSFMLPERRHTPQLWGVAFDCQRLASIEAEAWDVPLHGVITDQGSLRF